MQKYGESGGSTLLEMPTGTDSSDRITLAAKRLPLRLFRYTSMRIHPGLGLVLNPNEMVQ